MKARRILTVGLLALVTATTGAVIAQTPQAVGTWAPSRELAVPLPNGVSVALPDGRMLIAGGRAAGDTPTDGIAIYDPVSDTLTHAGTLVVPRSAHTVTLLKDGRVLIIGGVTDAGVISTDIERFDPATGTSEVVGQLAEPRRGHVAAALLDGTVLIAGGATTDGLVLQAASIFNPETNSLMPLATGLQVARVNASATTLLDGRVLIAGGSSGSADLASAEIFERYWQTFAMAATQMSVPRQGHSAVMLPHNGGVLVAGGMSNGAATPGIDLFLPAVFPDPFSYGEGEFTTTGAMAAPRAVTVAGPTSVEGYAFAASAGARDAEVYRFATIKTDKDDYAPGELAVITGSGWQSEEEVTLLFQEDPAIHTDYVLKVKADSAGNISWNQWAPERHDLGVRFYLTATGSQSRAQMTFTDADKTDVTLSSSQNPSSPGDSVTFTATVKSNGVVVQSGLVEFRRNATSCTGGGSGTVVATVSLNTSGQATTAVTFLSNGAVAMAACYLGSGGSFQKGEAFMTQNVGAAGPTSQTITVTTPSPASASFGSTFNVAATADSGLPVTITTSGSCSGGDTDGTATVTMTSGSGQCIVRYNQAGNTSFTAATERTNTTTATKASPVCTINGYTETYDATAHGASGSCVGVNNETLSGLDLGAKFTNVPGGTANWVFTDVTGNYNNANGTAAIVISKADATVNVSGYTGVYDGNEHGASGTATGVGGANLGGGLNLGAKFTNVPGGTAHWTFAGGTNYNDQSGDVAIVISKADATVNVSGYTGVYDGNEHGATGTATGVGGADLNGSLNLGTKFTNVPGGTAHWTFAGGTNYNDQSGDVAIVISKADATVNVSGYTGVYDGNEHGATGTATGVGGADLNDGLNLGAKFTNVPGGTAHWTFAGGTNYNDQSGDVAIVISKADATVNVSGYTGVYDGNEHGATGTATGVGGADLNDSLNLGTKFTNVPGGTAHWTFAGGTNYNDQSGDVAITISKANATVTVTGYTGVYDGNEHGAIGSATGVGGVALSGLDLGAKFTNVPGGTAHWTFAGGTNYNDRSGDAAIVISKAPTTVLVTCPMNVTYTGQPLDVCTAEVTGAGGLKQSLTVTYVGNLGAVQATAAYAGDANHTGSQGSATFAVTYRWDGFLQPINDTAHDQGAMSKFKAGQTIPAKFVLKNAVGAVVQQTGNPEFARTGNLGACDSSAAQESPETLPASVVPQYIWDGTQYHYNWSTKGLNAGLYRIFAKLADGTAQSVDICLTK